MTRRPAGAGAPWARLGLGVAVLAALGLGWWALSRAGVLDLFGDVERLRRLAGELGPWGPLAIVLGLAAAVVVSPIPSAPIALAAGAAFGKLWGSIYVVLGAELGALLAFAIARRLGYDAVRRWPSAARLLDRTRSQAALAGIVFASRLVPFLSFDAVSYAAGLTPLRWWWFAVATLAGVVPVSVALVWFGDRMVVEGAGWIMGAVLLLGVFTLAPLAFRALRKRRRHAHPAGTNSPAATEQGG